MAHSLKFVLLGSTTAEIKALIDAQSSHLDDAPVKQGLVAGCPVFRFQGVVETGEGLRQEVSVFGASMQSDYKALYPLLLGDADGVLALIPADLSRVMESRRILGILHHSLQERHEKAEEQSFLLQYQWAPEASSPSPDEIDNALRVNAQKLARIFVREGAPDQWKGLAVLAEQCSKENDAAL